MSRVSNLSTRYWIMNIFYSVVFHENMNMFLFLKLRKSIFAQFCQCEIMPMCITCIIRYLLTDKTIASVKCKLQNNAYDFV